jgi:hypothetical protein
MGSKKTKTTLNRKDPNNATRKYPLLYTLKCPLHEKKPV